jgi:hypothetical protein
MADFENGDLPVHPALKMEADRAKTPSVSRPPEAWSQISRPLTVQDSVEEIDQIAGQVDS